MIRILVCDDQAVERAQLVEMTKKYFEKASRSDVEIIACASGQDALTHSDIDVHFLDIVMPEMTGIELCEKLRRKNPSAKIVFCTTSREFAVEAFNLRAVHYLVKPASASDVFDILTEIFQPPVQKTMMVTTKAGLVKLIVSQISYVEYVNHHLRFCLSDGSEVVSLTSRKSFLQETEMLRNECFFLRSHEAFLVNPSAILRYRPDSFELVCGANIPISKLKRASMKEQYMDFLSEIGTARVEI